MKLNQFQVFPCILLFPFEISVIFHSESSRIDAVRSSFQFETLRRNPSPYSCLCGKAKSCKLGLDDFQRLEHNEAFSMQGGNVWGIFGNSDKVGQFNEMGVRFRARVSGELDE